MKKSSQKLLIIVTFIFAVSIVFGGVFYGSLVSIQNNNDKMFNLLSLNGQLLLSNQGTSYLTLAQSSILPPIGPYVTPLTSMIIIILTMAFIIFNIIVVIIIFYFRITKGKRRS